MQFTFLGGASEVGASCTLLEVAGHCLLIDGGMRPAAREGQSRLPDLARLETSPPEAILLTHAHIDHTGALPLIASLCPGIPIYATESTRVLTDILLRDSVRIMQQEGLKPDGETPLYSEEQVDALLARITPMSFQQPFAPIPSAPTLTLRFLPAGHILGAAMLFFTTPEGTVLHTGDISVTDQRTIKGLDLHALPQADVMVCEGTYGNRSHSNRKQEERGLAETVQQALARGGRVLCPAFAVGRAQEVALILKSYRMSGQVSPVPIYLDGMVRTVCQAYQAQSHDLHPSLQRSLTNARRPLFADPDLHIFAVRSQDRPALLIQHTPMIIISSSGMLSGGASPLYAAEMVAREQDCLLFSGYQDEESPGAALLQAKQGDQVRLGDQVVSLSCQVARYNLSGHADADQIVHVVTKVAPKRLILVHGSPESLTMLARRFSTLSVDIPAVGETLVIAPSRSSSAIRSGASSEGGNQSLVEQLPDAPVSSPVPAFVAPPGIEELWRVARAKGANRPWTSTELGQQYYGLAYRPAFRAEVEMVLKEAAVYFKQGRVGAQPTYLPRPQAEVDALRPLMSLKASEIVLVQGQQSVPQIALLLDAPHQGTVTLVADQWKVGTRPIQLIQLVPAIERADLLALPVQEAKGHLQAWRTQVEEEWVDLFARWKEAQGQPFTYPAWCAHLSTENQRLAWGLELLFHSHELFRRDGATWTPLEEERVLANPGYAHHLTLLEAGAGTPVLVKGRRATLTGRSNRRLFEIRWDEGEETGALARVRSGNIQFCEARETR